MTLSKPIQLFMAGIAALIFSTKIETKCTWCAIALQGVFLLLFIWGAILQIKKIRKIKRLKEKDLL